MKCKVLIIVLILLGSRMVFFQKAMVSSPNQKVNIGLYNQQGQDIGSWYLKVTYKHNGNSCVAMPQIDLGLICRSGDYSKDLKFLKANKPLLINEQYKAMHGKRSQRSNSANQVVVSFENSARVKLNPIIRAYNIGMDFRYEFPEKGESCSVIDELTAYTIADGTRRWLEKFNPANEGYYREYADGKVQQEWGYPALFLTNDSTTWYLIHEADLDRNYCGSKHSNTAEQSSYKVTFPDEWNGQEQGTPKHPAQVKVEGGIIQGTIENGLAVYKGIPFAAPPVGDLRWKAPQPPEKWDSIMHVDEFAPDPFQRGNPPSGKSEDCLYLNVWTPAKSSKEKLPVLVWIYGRGFSFGSTAKHVYNGEKLAKKGVVFVSIAYRIGQLGFRTHPELSAENSNYVSSNYGLLDQLAGLKWV
jgi:hypothetical protein